MKSISLWGTIIFIGISFLYYYKLSPYAKKSQEDPITRNRELLLDAYGSRYKIFIENTDTIEDLDKVIESMKKNIPELNPMNNSDDSPIQNDEI